MEKHTRVRKIFQNFGFLTLGKTLGDAFFFLFFIVLSRSFGQEGIGQYSFAIALTGFFSVFSDFGLHPFSIKELSRRTDWLRDCYSQIFSLRLILSAVAFGMLLLILPFLPFTRESKLIIVIIGAYQIIYTLGGWIWGSLHCSGGHAPSRPYRSLTQGGCHAGGDRSCHGWSGPCDDFGYSASGNRRTFACCLRASVSAI